MVDGDRQTTNIAYSYVLMEKISPVLSNYRQTKNTRHRHACRDCISQAALGRFPSCQTQRVDHATDRRLVQRPHKDDPDVP